MLFLYAISFKVSFSLKSIPLVFNTFFANSKSTPPIFLQKTFNLLSSA